MGTGKPKWLCADDCVIMQMPAEISMNNAGEILESILGLLRAGVRALIVDMSATTFCDVAGVRAVVRAHEGAHAHRADLRLAAGAPQVLRALDMAGDGLLAHIYPDLAAARAVTMADGLAARASSSQLRAIYDDGVLRITWAGSPPVLAIAGEIDESNYSGLAGTLDELADGHGEIHVNLADLAFCDLAGLRAILLLAGAGGGHDYSDRRLVLHNVPRQLRRAMQIVGWDTAPGLVIEEPEQQSGSLAVAIESDCRTATDESDCRTATEMEAH